MHAMFDVNMFCGFDLTMFIMIATYMCISTAYWHKESFETMYIYMHELTVDTWNLPARNLVRGRCIETG